VFCGLSECQKNVWGSFFREKDEKEKEILELVVGKKILWGQPQAERERDTRGTSIYKK